MPEEKFEFETKTGEVHTFNNKDERDAFSIEYSIINLVAEGYGDIVEINGERAFKINDRGRQYLKDAEGVAIQ